MDYEISCGFLFVNSESKKILLLKHLNDFEWDIPKGHQEKGEKLIETAYREVQEELGFTKNDFSVMKNVQGQPISQYFEYKSPVTGNIRRIYVFIGIACKNPVISKEHCGFAWCSLEEGLQYLRFESVQDCVKRLYSKVEDFKN